MTEVVLDHKSTGMEELTDDIGDLEHCTDFH
jgi:hypothetical protein